MRLKLAGWQRQTTVHDHKVTPVLKRGRRFFAEKDEPFRWIEGYKTRGRIADVALSGSFMVDFEFEPEDLHSWLIHLAKHDPQAALRLIGKAQAEAVISLAKAGEASDSAA